MRSGGPNSIKKIQAGYRYTVIIKIIINKV